MDVRVNDWNKLARGRPSMAGIGDPEVRRAIQAMGQTEDYLLRKIQTIRERPDDDKFPKTDVSKLVTDKDDSKKPQVIMVSGTWNEPADADLFGLVNPMGLSTNYYFQYGLDLSFGSVTGTASAGDGEVAEDAVANIVSLTVPAKYYVQIVAANSQGTTYSNVVTFDTGKKPEVTI